MRSGRPLRPCGCSTPIRRGDRRLHPVPRTAAGTPSSRCRRASGAAWSSARGRGRTIRPASGGDHHDRSRTTTDWRRRGDRVGAPATGTRFRRRAVSGLAVRDQGYCGSRRFRDPLILCGMVVPPDAARGHAERPFADLTDESLEQELTRSVPRGRDDQRLQLLFVEREVRRMLQALQRPAPDSP